MEKAHNQRTLKHTCTHSFVPWKPMGAPSDISEYYRTSETSPEPLRPYCTSSISDRPFHLLSSSLLLLTQALLFFSTLCLPPSFPPQPLPSHRPPLFSPPPFIFFFLPPPLSHLSPSLPRPLSSVPAGYSPDLDFHFPPLSLSYPLFLAEASGPWLAFCPPAFITPFLFFPWLSPHCVFTACYLGDFKEA